MTRRALAALTLWVLAIHVLWLMWPAALEYDEAEMALLARGWRWGYGPQFPLYNWVQMALIEAVGRTPLAFAAARAVFLWLFFAAAFLAARAWTGPGRAALAAALLLLVPQLSWEAARVTSHSVSLAAGICLAAAALSRALRRGTARDWTLVGLAFGIAALAKPNAWIGLVALILAAQAMPGLRTGLLRRRALWAPAVLAGVIALPYAWIAAHPSFTAEAAAEIAPLAGTRTDAMLGSLAEAAQVMAEQLALISIVAAPVLAFARRRPSEGAGFLLLAGGIATGLAALVIVVAAPAEVRHHWLIPCHLPLALGLALWTAESAGRRTFRGLAVGLSALAAAMAVAIPLARTGEGARGSLDAEALADLLDGRFDMARTRIVGRTWIGGNLDFVRPGFVVPYYVFPDGRTAGMDALFLDRLDKVTLDSMVGRFPPGRVKGSGTLDAPTHAGPPLPIGWVLLAPDD